jgi:SAM-dependent methyltransferase
VKSAIIFNRRHSSGLFRVLGVGLRLAHAGWMGIKSLLRGRLSLDVVRHYARGVREATREGSAAVSAAAAPEMVPGQCPLCHGRSLSFAFAGTDLLHETLGRFSVWECAACRLRFQFPLPPDFDALYPLDYGGYAPSARLTRSRFRGRSLQARVALLARLRPQGGRLLDVGCGSGDFLAAIAASGIWRAAGLEPNPAAARLAAKTPGITARVGDLSSPGDLAGPFDVITLWHALEHALTPKGRSALRSGCSRVMVCSSSHARWSTRPRRACSVRPGPATTCRATCRCTPERRCVCWRPAWVWRRVRCGGSSLVSTPAGSACSCG